jgi:hypothetical protein
MKFDVTKIHPPKQFHNTINQLLTYLSNNYQKTMIKI